METLINSFRTWLIANGNAQSTIINYIIPVTKFLETTKISDPKLITDKIVYEYIASIQPTMSQNTVNRYITSIRSFLDFNNILIRLPKRKEAPKKIIKIITQKDLEYKLLATIERELPNNVLRDKAIITFLYYGGLRIVDALNVKRSNFDFNNNQALVYISKAKEERYIVIPNLLIDILKRYFASEAEGKTAFNMTISQVNTLFKHLKFYHPELELHPHKFRKSYATYLKSIGMPLEKIQQMLGHKKIETTQIYVQESSFEDIKNEYLKLEKAYLKRKRSNKEKE
jgi:integrase/recombinase XerD